MNGRRPTTDPARRRVPRALLETRGHTLRQVELARELSRRAVKRARIQTLVLLPLMAAALLVYDHRQQLFGPEWDTVVRIVVALVLLSLGWQLARAAGRALGPTLFRRMEPATAGTIGFLIRLLTLVVAVYFALRVAGLSPRTLALGGAVTAVVVGLAAQQTFGNLFAGMVLISARSFRVGERVRLQGGMLAGTVEGVVTSQGLLYTTLASGEDVAMVPNSSVLNAAVVPLRQPTGVSLRAHLRPGVTPVELQQLVHAAVRTPIRDAVQIELEELTGEEVVVRIVAVPQRHADGPQLATEVLGAVVPLTSTARDETAREPA